MSAMRFIMGGFGPAPLAEQCGEHRNLLFLTRPNLPISFRVVLCEGDGEVILWGQPCRVVSRGLPSSRMGPAMCQS
jgi:hypothetical protein